MIWLAMNTMNSFAAILFWWFRWLALPQPVQRGFIVGCILVGLLITTAAHAQQDKKPNPKPKAPDEVRFCAMGDMPYNMGEWQLLEKYVKELPDDIDFVIHLGDIKRGKLPCFEPNYKRVAQILGKSRAPAFVVLGDNEWNDCLRPATGLKYWHRHLARLNEKWQTDFQVIRDPQRIENFAFETRRALFVGINIVGGEVLDKQEWKTRHAQNAAWVKTALRKFPEARCMVVFGHARPAKVHDDFFKPLEKIVKEFDRPVLYLHGDGHKWEKKKSFKGRKNLLRVQVDQGGNAEPVIVSVESGKKKDAFDFDRRSKEKKK